MLLLNTLQGLPIAFEVQFDLLPSPTKALPHLAPAPNFLIFYPLLSALVLSYIYLLPVPYRCQTCPYLRAFVVAVLPPWWAQTFIKYAPFYRERLSLHLLFGEKPSLTAHPKIAPRCSIGHHSACFHCWALISICYDLLVYCLSPLH